MKILDRYVLRETLLPFLMALGMFTFLLAVNPFLKEAQPLLAKGVGLSTIGFLLLTVVPQALGLTIPMAFMAAVLMALGRLSGDREVVALLACGVSPLRLLRPVLLMAVLAGGMDFYQLAYLIPDSNQRFREETFHLLAQKSESDIKPGIFYQGFPGKVLYVREARPGGGWSGVMLADTSQPGKPAVTLAPRGYLEVNEAERQVSIVLPGESVRYLPGTEEGVYDMANATDVRVAISAASVFGTGDGLARGLAELNMAALRAQENAKRAAGDSPHQEIIKRHQMFSIPVSSFVFAILGLALGLHTRKEDKLGGFVLGLGVIATYYAVMVEFESMTKGGSFPAAWARWMPNILLGGVGLAALWWRTRTTSGDLSINLPGWLRLRPRLGPSTGLAVPAPARIVVTIRIPNFSVPRPRLLDLYVAQRYLSLAALSFFGLLALYYVGTFIDKSERLFKGQANGWMLLEYFYYSTPQFIVYIAPMATLVAALATIGSLTRSSELTVMRACGVSLYRVAAPLFLLAIVWSSGLFLLDDRVLAHANQRAEVLEETIKGHGAPATIGPIGNANWLVDPTVKGRIYYYRAFDARRKTLHELSVFDTNAATFRLASHTVAKSATLREGNWWAHTGWTQQFSAPGRLVRKEFQEQKLALAPLESFAGAHDQETELMTAAELVTHISRLSESGVSLAEARVRLHERIAFPLVTLVMTLLGVSFGTTTGRRGALYGVGLAIILGSGHWLLSTFFLAAGQAGLLPAALAAWAANLLFLAAAGYLTLRVRT